MCLWLGHVLYMDLKHIYCLSDVLHLAFFPYWLINFTLLYLKLYVSVKVSFICSFFLLKLYIYMYSQALVTDSYNPNEINSLYSGSLGLSIVWNSEYWKAQCFRNKSSS
jgi:hypothetical protein